MLVRYIYYSINLWKCLSFIAHGGGIAVERYDLFQKSVTISINKIIITSNRRESLVFCRPEDGCQLCKKQSFVRMKAIWKQH